MAKAVNEERAQPFYSYLGALLRALAFFIAWAQAVRDAETDAVRFLTAGQQVIRDYESGLKGAETPEAFAEVVSRVGNLSSVEDVVEIAKFALRVPIPVLLSTTHPRSVGQPSVSEDIDQEEPEDSPPIVALLEFSFDGKIVEESQLITPNVLYDLSVRVRLSRWPTDQESLLLTPMHVEPSGSLEVPTFELEKPAELSTPIEVSATGRLCTKVSLDFPSRPLQITYTSTADSDYGGRIILEGQTSLSLEPIDPARNPATGFAEVDQRVFEIRRELRGHGVGDEEIKAFLALLGATGRVAALNLSGNIYPGSATEWPERRFQEDLRDRLRSAREVGSDLEEHPQTGGGITDLSYRRIRLELKVSSSGCSTQDAIASYGRQLVQYIAGSDRRTGFLVVLDLMGSGAASTVGEDIELVPMSPGTTGGRSILLCVVVIRGNLPTPSSLK